MMRSICMWGRVRHRFGPALLTLTLMSAAGCDLYGLEPLEPYDLEDPSVGSSEVDQVVLSIEAIPGDVRCLRVNAQGPTRTEARLIPIGGSQNLTEGLSGLPLGTVTFWGEAFEAECTGVKKSTIAGWVSAPVERSIVLGRRTTVKLVMARNGRANVDVSWTGEAACTATGGACRSKTECCSQVCTEGVCGS